MKRNSCIQLKAAFLAIIFSLNMLAGFACTIGVNMGFNSHHHKNEETVVSVQVYANGQNHQHEQIEYQHTDNDKKDDCCNEKVVKLSQEDKAVPQTAKLASPSFFKALVPVYNNISIFYPAQLSTSNKYYVHGLHPPIPDIRIAIQSFQI